MGENNQLRCGVIGCGFIGTDSPDSHFRAYQDCPDIWLRALCDIDLAKTASHLPPNGVGYCDYLAMVKSENLDVVSVCTPPETHCQIVCDIAPYVRAIYCEKPIATTLREADQMIDVCLAQRTTLQVNHQRAFYRPKLRWSRGGVLNNGSHAIALARQLCGKRWKDKIELEYVDTDEYIFEIDIASDPAPHRLVLKGVEHLVECLKTGKQSISGGEEARAVLKELLDYAELKGNPISDV